MQEAVEPNQVKRGPCCGGRSFIAFLIVSMFLACDQLTKWWTVSHLILGERRMVWDPWFEWVHFSNTGAAFGIMQDSNRFFIGLSVIAATAVIVMLWRNVFPNRVNFAAMLLLLPGILGNFTDRILHGYVVDFLLFDLGFYPANPWPAFNVADSCICCAVGLLLIDSVREEYVRRRLPKGGSVNDSLK